MWFCRKCIHKGSSRPRNQTRVSRTAGRRFTVWASREVPQEEPAQPKETNTKRSDSFKKPSHLFKTEKAQTWIMSGYIIWKRPWCWKRLKVEEGDNKGWDGWMASPTWWSWVWVSSGSWWWTGKPSMLQSIGSQRVGHDWATELNWTELVGNQTYIMYLTQTDPR